jgi:tetratricopeptide (TPR) repeat protein
MSAYFSGCGPVLKEQAQRSVWVQTRGFMPNKFFPLSVVVSGMLLTSAMARPVCAQANWGGFSANMDAMDSMEAELKHGVSSVVVHIQGSTGVKLEVQVSIKIVPNASTAISDPNDPYHKFADQTYTATTRNGLAKIEGINGGEYTLEVSAPGYETHRENLTVLGTHDTANAFVNLHAFDGSEDDMALDQPGVPVLNGQAHADLEGAIDDLVAGKLPHASTRVKSALKRAPDNPDVHFIAGYYDERVNDPKGAKAEYEKAVALYPNHFAAQLSLGNLLMDQDDYAGSIPHLEKAIAVGPNSWRAHWLLAEAYLNRDRDYEKARFHATRALELGKDKALEAQITLALADAIAGDIPAARERLEKFAADYPKDPRTARAKESLAMLDRAQVGPVHMHGTVDPTLAEDISPSQMPGLPSGIDEAIPPVNNEATCSLPQVMTGAALRALEFTSNIQNFSAKEVVMHEILNGKGVTVQSGQKTFDYLAALEFPRPDIIVVDEMRNGDFAVTGFPGSVAFEGIPGFALIFHPIYAKDFNFKCEGLGSWKGFPAWQIRFEQRADMPARIQGWSDNGVNYPVMIKGRAWLAADSYHIVHIETDLAQPLKEVKLEYEHVSISYQAVPYPKKKAVMWLPSDAEVYTKLKGHYSRQEHDFSNFQLFSTNTKEHLGDVPTSKDDTNHPNPQKPN